MEPVYLETTINDTLIRINKNDALDVYSWREWTKIPYWFKIKPSLTNDKRNDYESYKFNINHKQYILSRVVYKAHNNEWDITDTSNTNLIDHINNNSLDNRIENLRILTNQQNQWNTNAKGYCLSKRSNKWRAKIQVNGKTKYLGLFTEEADARNAYLEAKEKYHIIIA